MTQEKADYSQIAEVYDQARPGDSPHLEWWFRRLAEVGRLGPGKRLLDLGCGTGRWTIPLAARTGCDAVGVDSSQKMLERARQKDRGGRVAWLLGDVERLELESESFDCALMSLMMHHLEDHLSTFRGVLRVLRPGGVFLIRQGTLEQIANDPWHRFFPEALTIDRKRTPLRAETEWWLREAGFELIEVEEVRQLTYPDRADLQIPLHHGDNPDARESPVATSRSALRSFLHHSSYRHDAGNSIERMLAEVRLRVPSVLRLISDGEYERGRQRLERYVEEHSDDRWLRETLFTLFSARKPAGEASQGTQ